MNKIDILANLPVENLSKENDYLGVLEKGNLISTFLKGNKSQFDKIKMFSLYGEWGSGKSSLMKFLENDLKGDFNTFFFEAWQFEKDENLAMSLLEFINAKNVDTGEEFCQDLLKFGGRILRGLGRSVKFNIPLYPKGPSVDLDMNGFVDEFSKKEEISFYKSLKSFKTEFIRLEDKLKAEKKKDYNIVFIDDLDRCEPEQVLNLLSAIKLFFTYGQRTIFFCGIDKVAVNQAVKTKYGKVIKANEYLEKIFDISFSMPGHNNLLRLVDRYFDNRTYTIGSESRPINYWISDFFEDINFTNPRRVKKVLNKFNIIREFRRLLGNFPNIDMADDRQRSYFETILVIYLIILHEFYPDIFVDFLNFEKMAGIYSDKIRVSNDFNGLRSFINRNLASLSLNEIKKTIADDIEYSSEVKFKICFGPLKKLRDISVKFFNTDVKNGIFESTEIDYLFYVYITKFSLNELLDIKVSNNSLNDIKKIVANVL
ncbi:KAP family NTPase [Flavobacterium sp. NRK F10]|uniref:KAP family P-loop NTPase fold protein n=1 Tax=Flavobacterium sp. NRK F10 TaxID=2954931 RepID=UPI0020903411|nr:P-loop NTPase fold protein [Flavobacterium sp. NRK F10]MCO6175117.1 KAP family NTPase [Flavobacterium sp. NRK F10]